MKEKAETICAIICAILLAIILILSTGCDERVGTIPAGPIIVEAELPKDVSGLASELKNVRARARILEGALADAKNDAAQSKLWIGAGTCFLACLVLVAIGIWTTRRLLVKIGLGVGALGGLLIFAAWLVPYALYIGLTIGALVAVAAVYMLVNRERALTQVTRAVGDIKELVPNFRGVFNSHIDERSDRLLDSIRGVADNK